MLKNKKARITSLRNLYSKMCVFGEGGFKLLSPTVGAASVTV